MAKARPKRISSINPTEGVFDVIDFTVFFTIAFMVLNLFLVMQCQCCQLLSLSARNHLTSEQGHQFKCSPAQLFVHTKLIEQLYVVKRFLNICLKYLIFSFIIESEENF